MKNILLLLFAGTLFLTSCSSDDRPEKIEAIKNGNSTTDEKIKDIVELTAKCYTCGELNYDVFEDEEDGKFVDIVYSDDSFIFSSNEAMKSIVQGGIARTMWRTLYATKDLGVNAVTLSYGASIRTDMGFQMVSVFEGFIYRVDAEKVSGLYEVNPFENHDMDVFSVGSEQDITNQEVLKQITFVVDQSSSITF